MPSKNLFKIIMLTLPIFVLVFSLFLFLKRNQQPTTSTTNSQPEITPTESVFVPSKWVQDQEVLDIENSLLKLEKDLANLDLGETQLLPPVLDLNVKFK